MKLTVSVHLFCFLFTKMLQKTIKGLQVLTKALPELSSRHKSKTPFGVFDLCAGEDLNLHALRRTHLKGVRLPISPPAHCSLSSRTFWLLGRKFDPYRVGIRSSIFLSSRIFCTPSCTKFRDPVSGTMSATTLTRAVALVRSQPPPRPFCLLAKHASGSDKSAKNFSSEVFFGLSAR